MALQFSRNTKVYLELGANVWEIPVMDGFSLSQSTTSSEITLNEAGATSRRARLMFNDSLNPVDWSFTTYMRPFVSVGTNVGGTYDGTDVHCVEEALWGAFVGAGGFNNASPNGIWTPPAGGTGTPITYTAGAQGTRKTVINFSSSNVSNLSEAFNLFFVFSEGNVSAEQGYEITQATVTTASIDFDIDGIASITWTGFGKQIIDIAQTAPPATLYEGTTNTAAFIRTRLSDVQLTRTDVVAGPYNVVLTGGNITFENNISYLTPEELGKVNVPLGNVTGARSVSGTLNAYLDTTLNGTSTLLDDLLNSLSTVRNSFDMSIHIGGLTRYPKVVFKLPTAHLEVPTTTVEDVMAVEINFHGQVANEDVNATNEATIEYFA